MEDKQNESINKKENKEKLVGWGTTDDQEKEIVKKREKKDCTTGQQITII